MSCDIAGAYKASGYATSLHGMPRITGGSTVPTASSEVTSYIIGISILPGFFALLYLFWVIALCCPCCRRCGSTLSGHALNRLRLVFAIVTLFAAGACVATYFGSSTLNGGFDHVIKASKDMESVFNEGADLATQATTSLDAVVGKLSAIEAVSANVNCSGATGPAAEAQVKNQLDTAAASVRSESALAKAELQSFTDEVPDTVDLLSSVNEYMDQASFWRSTGTLIVLGMVTFICMLFIIAVALGFADREYEIFLGCMSRVVVPTSITLLLLLVIFGVLYTVLAFVSSDVCGSKVGPDDTLLSQVEAHSSATNANLTKYFITCEGSNPFLDEFTDTEAKIGEAKLAGGDAVTALQSMEAAGCSSPDKDAAITAAEGIIADLTTLEGVVTDAKALVSCGSATDGTTSLDEIYRQAVHCGFCGDVLVGSTQLWIPMFVLEVLLLVVLTMRSVYQPGDEAFTAPGENPGLAGYDYEKSDTKDREIQLRSQFENDYV